MKEKISIEKYLTYTRTKQMYWYKKYPEVYPEPSRKPRTGPPMRKPSMEEYNEMSKNNKFYYYKRYPNDYPYPFSYRQNEKPPIEKLSEYSQAHQYYLSNKYGGEYTENYKKNFPSKPVTPPTLEEYNQKCPQDQYYFRKKFPGLFPTKYNKRNPKTLPSEVVKCKPRGNNLPDTGLLGEVRKLVRENPNITLTEVMRRTSGVDDFLNLEVNKKFYDIRKYYKMVLSVQQ